MNTTAKFSVKEKRKLFISVFLCAALLYVILDVLNTQHLGPSSNNMSITTAVERSVKPEPHKCDCVSGPASCCQRSVCTIHKMGDSISYKLPSLMICNQQLQTNDPHHVEIDMSSNSKINRGETCGHTTSFGHSSPRDYRLIIPVRNWYDALISGYNYHKTGRECWLDFAGRPFRISKAKKKM